MPENESLRGIQIGNVSEEALHIARPAYDLADVHFATLTLL